MFQTLTTFKPSFYYFTVNAFMKIKGICVTKDKFMKKCNFKDTKIKREKTQPILQTFLKVLFCIAISA